MKENIRTYIHRLEVHTVDLETEVVLSVEISYGNETDTNTLLDSVSTAQGNLQQAGGS